MPCDPNSKSCSSNRGVRVCGECRYGFYLKNGRCVNILLDSYASETVAFGTLEDTLNIAENSLDAGEDSAGALALVVEIIQDSTKVWLCSCSCSYLAVGWRHL
jgi:hypothetical protein